MKRMIKLFGVLIVLLVVAALAAPMFINQETIKAQLIAQVKKATGRTLEIKGDTSVKFFPNIAVSAEDVSLSNPEGFTTPYLVSLKKLETGAELRPLLRGELLINGITLDGATINLEELESGAKNWEFAKDKLKDSAEEAAAAPEAQKKSQSPIKRFALGDVTISDSAVNILKPGANVMALSNIDLNLQGVDANSPLKLEGSAEYKAEKVSIALDIAKTRDFLDNKLSPITASIKLPGASVDFKGEARMGDSIAANGKLDANAASLPQVLAWATGKKPAGNLPKQVAASGTVDYMNKILKLGDATLRADDTKATGSLAINHGGAVPKIAGNLNLGIIDLDALSGKPSTGSTLGNASERTAPQGWSTEKIDLSGLKAVDADLNLAFEKLTSGKFNIGATQAHTAINGGKLALTIKQAQFYSGTLSGVVRAAASGIGADVKANAIDIEAFMIALSGKSRLEGKTNLALNVNANGSSQAAWVNSLNGNGTLKVVDGALKGINIGSFLRNAKQGNFFKSDTESTDFTDLTATYTITNGVLDNKDLAMKSPALRVAGAGSANLPNKTINYRLTPTIAETSKGQGGKDQVAGLSIPLVITGPWSSPSVTPDLAGMAKDALQNPDTIKTLIENPKDIGDVLLGKKPAAGTAPAPATTDGATPATAPLTEKERRTKAIEEGIGGLLKGL